ncbi:MAG: hypothetical protein ACRCU5_11950, partial [Rhizobiaceae bacterium]
MATRLATTIHSLEIFGWLPVPLTDGIFHIWGARRLVEGASAKATLLRILAVGIFIAINLFPAPGLCLFYVGVAGGIGINLTVIGMVVAPVVGVLVTGFCAGLLLGLLAGMPTPSMNGPDGNRCCGLWPWRRRWGRSAGAWPDRFRPANGEHVRREHAVADGTGNTRHGSCC